MRSYIGRTWIAGLSIAVLAGTIAARAQSANYAITVTSTGFLPAQLTVPAGQAFNLTLTNASGTTVELEVNGVIKPVGIGAGRSAVVTVTPLTPGSYTIMDDLHPSVAGTLVAQ